MSDHAREAALDRISAKAERRLAKAGVPEKNLARAVKALGLTHSTLESDLPADIDDLREDLPELFAESSRSTQGLPAGAGARPATRASRAVRGKSMQQLGEETARRFGLLPKDDTRA
jgi:hypothetical protein